MRTIELDASSWETPLDFICSLQAAIGAPKGHGSNIDAFVDSMIWGGMNRVEPPYEVCVVGGERMPKALRDYIDPVASALASGRKWKREKQGEDTEVSLRIAASN
jgi:hypothetical protein